MRPLLSKCCLRKGKVIRQKDPKSTEIPKGITCALCKRLLRGLINLGLSCQDCGKNYHKECFDSREYTCWLNDKFRVRVLDLPYLFLGQAAPQAIKAKEVRNFFPLM